MGSLFVLSAALWLSSAAPAERTTALLVLPLDARNGVTVDLSATVTEVLVVELRKNKRFRVTTLREVEGVLNQAQREQLAGCEGSCVIELGTLLKADEIVGGSLGRVGTDLVITVNRLNARDGTALGSSSRRVAVARETALLDVIPVVTQEIVEGKRVADHVVAPSGGTAEATQVASANPRSSPPPHEKSARIRMAVLPLRNTGKNADMEVLSKGLMDVLITDLNQCSDVQVVEREQLNALMGELKMQQDKAFDAATTEKLGKLLGVQYLVLGSYFEFGGAFRMDAVVTNVSTGAHLAAQGVSGKRDEVLDLEKQLVLKLLDSVSARVADDERTRYRTREPAVKLEDVAVYSKALDAYDRGDKKGARESTVALLARVPGFAAAQGLLARLDKHP